MPRRMVSSVLLALAAVVSSAAAQPLQPRPTANQPQNPQNPQGTPGATPQQGQGPAQRGRGPRPYRDVITAQALTDSGVFITHRIGDSLYYEIPRAMLNREFLLIVDQKGTARGVRYAGEQVSDRIVLWERRNNRVFLRLRSYAMRADSTNPISRAVNLSNLSPIVMSFDVAAYSPGDSNLVIDVTRLFTTDVWELNARQSGLRVRQFDAQRSLIERARSFPRNVEVSALHTFAMDSVPGQGRSVNSLTMLMNYSMVLLPDVPMTPRLCDERVGYFGTTFEDFNQDRVPRAERCYIDRFRLEAQIPNARVSDPIEPITWYVDPATPAKWVPWVVKGVDAWEPVFRAAGFSNGIRARLAPMDDPDFDLDDARYSTIRWTPSTVRNAYGPHVRDPRTGQTISANVIMYHNIADLVEAWYWTQAGVNDPRARTLPLPDSLMGEMIMWVVTHEVGHSIGLQHNQLASTFYPVDSLRSRSFTCGMRNTSPSIMDYARYNYVAQPGDNACLMQGLGAYDYFVIDWGYRRVPGAATPEAERAVLDSLARLQDTNPYFRFMASDPADPRIISEALGDDPVRATTLGLANIRRLVPMLIPATTTNRLQNYERLRGMYNDLLAQWSREMGHVAGVVGGVYRTTRYAGQAQHLYDVTPRARQQEAVRFLLAEAFTTPTYFLDTALLSRLEPSGSVERVRQRQAQVLSTLLGDARLARLVEQQAFATAENPAYTMPEFFADLRRGLFSEAAAARPAADAYRRNLQRHFVDQMERLISTPLAPTLPPGFPAQFAPAPRPADARALARAELTGLDTQLRSAGLRTTEPATRAHWADLRARIDRILNPR